MPDQEQIAQQQRLLETHRQTLAHYLGQLAALGSAYAPPGVTHGIHEARAEIKRCKVTLQDWGAQVDDLPDDLEQSNELDTSASSSAKMGRGMEALVDLMRLQEVRAAVAVYQSSFGVVCEQIAVLSAYKVLHDLLQQLEDRHTIVLRCRKLLPIDQGAWAEIELNEPEIYAKADELLEYAGRPLLVNDTSIWTPRLARAQQELRAGLESYSDDRLKDALGRLKEIIDRQLSRIDTRLVSIAAALRLATLVESLRQICDEITRIGLAQNKAARLVDFRQGVESLAGLDAQLTETVALHTAFQEFDDELRRIESLLEQDLSELADAWQDLRPMMQALCAGNTALWATRLLALGEDLQQVLEHAEPLRLQRAFSRYRSHAMICFNRVDHDLLNLCAVLQQIGTPLDHVLRMLQ